MSFKQFVLISLNNVISSACLVLIDSKRYCRTGNFIHSSVNVYSPKSKYKAYIFERDDLEEFSFS